ncbi:MAG: hypothetical protein Q8R28_05425, partial [Dehalococcoidia bacterium]|nr:hypothetical protein [Dehalococcoidia bacterium]
MSFDHNSNVNTTIVLGVADPEMGAIETLAREAGWAVLYAAAPARDGQLVRVLSGGAYQATALIDAVGAVIEADPLDDTYLIECGGPAFESFEMVARCDHHNFGDWGYGRPPAEFLAASSLGQVIGTLAREGAIPLSWQHGMITPPRVGLPVGWIYQREVDLGAELGEWAAGYNVSGIRTVAEVVLRGGVFAR